jgi:hypothetical protein
MPFAGIGLVLGGAFLVTWFWPHYIAPIIGPWAILLTNGARRLALLQPGAIGRKLLWLVLGMAALTASVTVMRLYAGRSQRDRSWPAQRAAIASDLERQGGRHLVLVSYGAKHSFHNEWVHNAANLETAPVIWARSLAPGKDSLLCDHFQDRFVWRLHVDSDSTRQPLRPVSQPLTADVSKR